MNSDNLTELLQYPRFIKKVVDNKIHNDEIHLLAETAYSGENFNFALLRKLRTNMFTQSDLFRASLKITAGHIKDK